MGGKCEGNVNFKVASICFDSRLIFNETNGLFVAIKTTKNDGHKFIREAYEKGIRCFVTERPPKKKRKRCIVYHCKRQYFIHPKMG